MVTGKCEVYQSHYILDYFIISKVLQIWDNLFRNFRFVAGPDNYEASTGNSANSCFCSGINSESALCGKKDGLFDVSECQYGAPVLVSWPHFYQVQNVYKRNKRNANFITASIKI